MTTIENQEVSYAWRKVLLWGFLFYLVWNWKGMVLVFSQGVLPGPDDFLRYHQAQNWLLGQGWFDTTAYRMFPPSGGDIHWTRFIDAAIGGVTAFFNLFTDLSTAGRITAIVWPLSLFMLAVAAMVAICERLAGKENRLLALFFFVLSINTLAEFKPGRLDHHNVQILLFILIMLGIVRGLGRYSSYLVGVLIAVSIMTGLDSLLLLLAALAFLALEWVFKREGSATRLFETGLALGVTSSLLYVSSFPPGRWFSNHACDAFSLFYLSALLLVSAAFMVLSFSSRRPVFAKPFARVAAGACFAIAIVTVLFSAFPDCLGGPYGNVDADLKLRWLDKITEAKGIIERFPGNPSHWTTQIIYLALMLTVIAVVLSKKAATQPELAVLGFIVAICVLGAFYQTRILRTGIYSVIPFCVIFAAMCWNWLEEKFKSQKVIAYASQALICLLMTSTFWVTTGFVSSSSAGSEAALLEPTTARMTDPDKEIACTSDLSMANLAQMPVGHVMSDLNTATAILVHTPHSVEGGSYHRNGSAILNVISFFERDLEEARQIAVARKADYVTFCQINAAHTSDSGKGDRVSNAIRFNQLPDWLEWASTPQAALAILKVKR